MPLISVVLCTYRREALAQRSAASVLEQDFRDFELIVVDQDPSRRLEAALRRVAPADTRLRYELCPRLGLSHARNFGVESARAPCLVFLDDDARALPGWLRSYAEAFAGPPPAMMVGGRLLPEWERPKPRWYPTGRLSQLGLYDAGPSARPFPDLDLPIGANFGVRREALLAAGGFDTSLGYSADNPGALGGEDSLLGARIRRSGGLILYHPGAVAAHLVRRDKVTLRAFVRRGVIEGRTQVAFTTRDRGLDREWLQGAAAWHRRQLAGAPRRLASALLAGRAERWEALGEWLAGVSLSVGVVRECRRLLAALVRPGAG